MKISSSLPQTSELNGLSVIEHDMTHKNDATHVAIIQISTKSITTNVQEGYSVATIQIDHIEPITNEIDAERAWAMLAKAKDRRTGEQQIDYEKALKQAATETVNNLAVLDLSTGEVKNGAPTSPPAGWAMLAKAKDRRTGEQQIDNPAAADLPTGEVKTNEGDK